MARTSASLYVGDLAPTVGERELFEIFNAVGSVASVRVCRDETRRSLGYAYVNFNCADDAARAIDVLNFRRIQDRPCRVTMAQQRDAKSRGGNIFIRGLAKSVDAKLLYDSFCAFGEILSCKIKTNRNGESTGFGFIRYTNETTADTAVATTNDMLIAGERVEVAKFNKQRHVAQRAKNDSDSKDPFLHQKTKFDNSHPLVHKGKCLYVKNLADSVDDMMFHQVLSPVAKECVVHMITDPTSGRFKGSAVVYVQDDEIAQKVITRFNCTFLEKKMLCISLAQRKETRDAQLATQFACRSQLPTAIPRPALPSFKPPQKTSPAQGPTPAAPVAPGAPAPAPASSPAVPSSPTSEKSGYTPVSMRPAPPSLAHIRLPPAVLKNIDWTDKQSIGEVLYPRIQLLDAGRAAKITGMLLEMDSYHLRALLVSDIALKSKVREAQEVIEWGDKQTIREMLFLQVQAVAPLKTEKIVSVLAEMNADYLGALLANEHAMKSKILEIQTGLLDWSDKLAVKALLLQRVRAVDATRADAITAMLSKMELSYLKLLSTSDRALQTAVTKCQESLSEGAQLVSPPDSASSMTEMSMDGEAEGSDMTNDQATSNSDVSESGLY